MRRIPVFAALAVTALVAVAGAAHGAGAPRLCSRAKLVRGVDGSAPVDGVTVQDRFGTRTVDLRRATAFCETTGLGDETPPAAAASLVGFLASASGQRAARAAEGPGVGIVNRFGSATLRLVAFERLLVPAVTAGAAALAADGASPLSCWTVRGPRPARRPPRVAVADADGERLLEVRRPRHLCVSTGDATDVELVCYAVRPARARAGRQPEASRRVVSASHAYGDDVLRTGSPAELCVPSDGPPPPPPPSGVRLRISPASVTTDFGLQPRFAATAEYADGRPAEDWTARVAWRSSAEDVALWKSSVDGAFLVTRGPGTTTIAATDPQTGLDSTTSGDDAILTVRWSLEKITISPHAVRKPVGGAESFTATGHFAHGVTRNLTQRLVWTTDDASVALPPSRTARAAGDGGASRITAVAPGSATVTALDPISGISSGDSGNDATLRVGRVLEWIEIPYAGTYDPGAFPGDSYRFTAVGHFSDGTTRALTQEVQWSTSDPAVAVATNPDGDRSRVDAVAPGYASVKALDPVTRSSAFAAFVAYGPLESLEVVPGYWYADPIQVGEHAGYLALAIHRPGVRNVSQDVVWTSDDPNVAAAPNLEGARSEIVGVAPGRARIVATDPQSGLSSASSAFVVGPLVALEVVPRRGTERLPVGGEASIPSLLQVLGIFGNGSLWLSSRDPDSYVVTTSDPGVAAVVDGGATLRTLAPGVVHIGARHLATGVSTPGFELIVYGPLERIALTPTSATRGIGESESFLAIGHFPPGLTTRLTQNLVYVSSDPSVVVAENAPGNRSRVRTVGAGTAIISAVDLASGLRSSDTGDDAVVSVVPGTLDRITVVAPTRTLFPGDHLSLTAIGHYPDGRTLNVTQQVTWSSLTPQVAVAENTPGDRSRIEGVAPGVATIVATHPTGVSSHASGGDAGVSVERITSLTMAPASLTVRAGHTVRFTITGTLGTGPSVNLTQRVFYSIDWSPDAWNVARVYNADGDRSAVQAVGPGTVTVRAYQPLGDLTATATLTVVP